MAPKPQEFAGTKKDENRVCPTGEEIVISGMSGLYPDCNNVMELSNVLYNKINPINNKDLRWEVNHPEVTDCTGKAPGLEYFDAQFFRVHYRLANCMDPMSRKILEQSYQAIYDAGISCEYFSGKKVGVYLGTCFSETEKTCFYVNTINGGFGIAGCSKAMFANRISYWLNSKGPSMVVDQACCSSSVALELAYQAIKRGDCEAALVGGSSLCLHPHSFIHYGRIMSLSMDGKTRSFDQNGCGCAKSDAINVLLLQKSKDAIRVYAELVHVKSEFTSLVEGHEGPRYGFYRDPEHVANFLKEFYYEANVPPKDIEYVEAFGSGLVEADESELKAIDEVFCKDRQNPLPIGSVMSNIGYGEASSGVSSITKVLLGFERGEFAGNISLETPRNDVAAIRDGRIKVITDHSPTNHGYVAVNTFSVTGSNAHVLLKGRNKPKDLTRYKSSIPRLVTISARQDSALLKIFADLKSRTVDPEELALFHNIHQTPVAGHLGRGYLLLDTNEANETVALSEKCEYFDNAVRPLWFVYSGMGSQWAGMGTHLMRIPVFSAAIEKCRRVLEPKGVDIVSIITSPDKTIFDNILHSFVGIAAVQIGLTDVLHSIGIFPDKIIGHSVGELGCAYADGCFTAEEMILSAYSRGLVSVQTPFIRGSMAAVGLGFTEISKLCPPEIEVACHNASESSTISGPAEVMKEFVASLTAKNIFAKEVPCSNIAFHSRYIAEGGPALRQYLSEVIKDPKPRSERWLSTSVPESRWEEDLAKYSSAEYHTNNLLNPVLFEETSRNIPADAVLIEIAPHGLLQAILKRSLPESCKNIPLTRRGHLDNARFLLEAIGQLFMEGYNPKLQALYPKVEFPVSTGTPMLSHHVEWAHTESWILPLFKTEDLKNAAACKFIISVHDDEYNYLRGHVVKGMNTYPFAGALTCVWDTFSMVRGIRRRSESVRFRDVRFTVQPLISEQQTFILYVTIHRGTGRFEVYTKNTEIVTGYIIWNNVVGPDVTTADHEELSLTSDDIYKLLKTKDYNYCGDFRSISKASTSLSQAKISWNKNWVTLIDGLIQLNMLKKSHGSSELEFIRQIDLNVDKMPEDVSTLDAYVSEVLDVSRCSGVTFHNVRFCSRPASSESVSVKAYKFVPHFPKGQSNESSALAVFLQIVAENVNKSTINVLVVNGPDSKYSGLKSVVEQIPGVKVNLACIDKRDLLKLTNIDNQVDVLLLNDLSLDESLTKALHDILPRDFFIINKEFSEPKQRPASLYIPVSSHRVSNAQIQLISWRPNQSRSISSAVTVHSTEDLALLKSSLSLLPAGQNLLIVSTYPKVPGLSELVKQWSKASIGSNKKIYMIEINHKVSNEQCLNDLPPLNLTFNVLDHGIWGGKYYLPVERQVESKGNAILQISHVGDIDSLTWVETPEPTGPGINVKVHYSTLNSLDTKRSMGVVPIDFDTDLTFGMDFSGVTESGVRVMGLVKSGSVSAIVRAKSEQLWPVPAHWTLEDAATVPLAYCLAFYCLSTKSRLLPGMSILVHGGTGALAQAAISIALAFDCEVFTTVSDLKKKQFVKKLFPQLQEDHIGNSRNHSFADMVRSATNGRGVDIIISCANKEFKNTSIGCLAEYGVYYDASLLIERENFTLGMNNFSKCRSYATIDIRSIFQTEHDMKRLQVLVSEGIARGYVRPLSRVSFPPSDVSRAFRLLAASRHRGRVLLDMQQPIPDVKPRLQISPESCNLIISDDDVLAIQLADRLVAQGAKQLYIQAPYSNAFLVKQRSWQDAGVHVVIDRQELWNKKYIECLLNKSTVLGKIQIIYMIVSKAQKYTDVTTYLDTLDTASRKLTSAVEHFAVIDIGNRIGDDVFTSATPSKHNVTIIKSPDFESVQGFLSFKSILNVLEEGLNSKEPVIVVQVVPNKKSLLDHIAAIAKIDLPKTLEDTLTLQELCKDTTLLFPLREYLRDQYRILLSEEAILDLSISQIKNIEENMLDATFKDVDGFAQFYSYVDVDELRSTTEMVFLPSLVRSSAVMDDEFDANQNFICLIPGLEGHNGRFEFLAERLKLFALVLQPGLTHPDETPQEMAARFAKTLIKRTGIKGHFYLLGYEAGVIVALEMAKILEEQDLTGTVFCLGGTPEDIVSEVNLVFDKYKSQEDLQDDLIRHMLRMNLSDTTVQIDLKGTWEEKVSSYVHKLIGKVPLSSQYNQDYIKCAYSRMRQLLKYKDQATLLKSQVIFLKSKLAVKASDSLQKYSEKPVVVYDLDTSLANVARDLRCSAIVNRHLEPNVLQNFDESNICFTYSMKAKDN
ncbi:fatty acid synthase-like [Pieris brassicae]|uniref:fatty acid synthase-like n=1 Tax=Pieris brassicae TaxID=7116 RepID=UPI001E6622C0|nr:fatty acid synthase-like [Pieris brassicae]XP_045518362.1 fatty acid synthase-like [Pieris brassicae]